MLVRLAPLLALTLGLLSGASTYPDCSDLSREMAHYFPHETDCNKFYLCTDDPPYVPYINTCPPGLHFNDLLEICDWPENAGCMSVIDRPTTHGPEIVGPVTDGPGNEVPEVPGNGGSIQCPAVDPMDTSIYFPHESNCSFFYQCSNGVPFLQPCPSGLHFNPTLNFCDWPRSAGCLSETAVPGIDSPENVNPENEGPGNVDQSSENNGSDGETSDDGPISNIPENEEPRDQGSGSDGSDEGKGTDGQDNEGAGNEGPGSTGTGNAGEGNKGPSNEGSENDGSDNDNGGVEVPVEPGSGASGLCPAVDPMDTSIYLPHESNCSFFYQCSNGFPILLHCPSSLHFNPTLNVCDWPRSAGCLSETEGTGIDGPGNENPENEEPGNVDQGSGNDGSDEGTVNDGHTSEESVTNVPENEGPGDQGDGNEGSDEPATERPVIDGPENEGPGDSGDENEGSDESATDRPVTDEPENEGSGDPGDGNEGSHDSATERPVTNEPENEGSGDLGDGNVGSDENTTGSPVTDEPENGVSGDQGDGNEGSVESTTERPNTDGAQNEDPSIEGSGNDGPDNDNGGVDAPEEPESGAPGQCPAIDPMDTSIYLPHESNCSFFYQCSNGIPILLPCPGDLHFNPTLNVCDWPRDAGCLSESGGTSPGETDPNESDPDDSNTGGSDSPGNRCSGCLRTSLYWPDPEDNSQYWSCLNGEEVFAHCSPGLLFNPDSAVCDYSENVIAVTVLNTVNAV